MSELAGARASAEWLRHWLLNLALPLWASAGWNAAGGGFHERLHLDGTADIEAVRRVRVQARQIYVYAHAHVLRWHSDGARLALAALDALLQRFHAPDGSPGFVHTVRPDGTVANALRDTYDHAFILLALAWLARASGDPQVRRLIDAVLAYLDEHLADADGSFHEGFPRSEPRRQNPHMHLFEAMLALHEAVAHPEALTRAARLRTLLVNRFIEPATGTLTEYFTEGWGPWPGSRAIEPGHHAEWCWLLHRHDELAGLAPDSVGRRLLDVAVRFADPWTGLLPDDALPDASAVSSARRCWPQTELAKGWLAQHESGAAGAAAAAGQALRNVRSYYLAHAHPGGWIDQVGAAGEPLAKSIPASTLYHLFVAIAEADRVLGSP